MHEALGDLLRRVWGVSWPRGIEPFQACVSSVREVVSLRLAQIPDPSWADRGPTVRVTAQNLTSETLPFLASVDPVELFSATVLDPGGQPAKTRTCLFTACEVTSGAPAPFALLPPMGKESWDWIVGQDFEMLAPGIYSVSLGERLDYLDATVCSNTAYVTVK